MASFRDHISQAEENISFLFQIRTLPDRNLSWEVTVCYYIAVHLMNARIADKLQVTFDNHSDINKNLFYDKNSSARIFRKVFITYKELTRLSRISRYLMDPNLKNPSMKIRIEQQDIQNANDYTNTIIAYFNKEYNLQITPL